MTCWSRRASASRRSVSDSSALARSQRSRRYWCSPSDSILLRSAQESSCSRTASLAWAPLSASAAPTERLAASVSRSTVRRCLAARSPASSRAWAAPRAARFCWSMASTLRRTDVEVVAGQPGRLLQHEQGHARGVGDGEERGDAFGPSRRSSACAAGRPLTAGLGVARRSHHVLLVAHTFVASGSKASGAATAASPAGAPSCAGQGTTSERARDSTRMVTETPRSRSAGPIIGSSAVADDDDDGGAAVGGARARARAATRGCARPRAAAEVGGRALLHRPVAQRHRLPHALRRRRSRRGRSRRSGPRRRRRRAAASATGAPR